MDVNEQIAKAYFEEIHSYIVKTNHHFKKKREKGTGPADIDLVMIYPRDDRKGKFGKKAICSVKGWQSQTIGLKDIKNEDKFNKKWRIFEKEELEAAKEFFGDYDFNKILIVPPIKKSDIMEAKQFCRCKYDIILLDFAEIFIELI